MPDDPNGAQVDFYANVLVDLWVNTAKSESWPKGEISDRAIDEAIDRVTNLRLGGAL